MENAAASGTQKKARDGAIGLEDQWLAPTEEGFMSSETSNSAAPRVHVFRRKKRYPIGYLFRKRETGLEPAASTLARSRSTN